MLAAARASKAEWKNNNPDYASKLDVLLSGVGVVKGQVGISKAILTLIEMILWQGYAHQSQKAILEEAQAKHKTVILHSSIWQKKLQKWAVDKMKLWAEDRGYMIGLKGCNTLSEFKKRTKAYIILQQNLATTKKITVTFERDTILIGKKMFPITQREAKGIIYPSIRVTVSGKYQWIRVDAIKALMLG